MKVAELSVCIKYELGVISVMVEVIGIPYFLLGQTYRDFCDCIPYASIGRGLAFSCSCF